MRYASVVIVIKPFDGMHFLDVRDATGAMAEPAGFHSVRGNQLTELVFAGLEVCAVLPHMLSRKLARVTR